MTAKRHRRPPRSDDLMRALGRLQPREVRILRLRWIGWQTYEEIGLALGLSRERIAQLCHKAEKRLAAAFSHPAWGVHQIARSMRAEPPAPPPLRALREWSANRYGRRAEPFGTLDEILDALHPFPLEEKTRLVEAAVDFYDRGITKRK